MEDIQKQALSLMEAENLGTVLVAGFGWVWPTNIRNDHGRFGLANALVAAQLIVEQLGETYGQRYARTTDWYARNMAKDLMEMCGKDALVSEHDEERMAGLERENDEAESTYEKAMNAAEWRGAF